MQADQEITVRLTVGEVEALRDYYLTGDVVGEAQEAVLASAHGRIHAALLGEVDRRIEVGRRLLASKGLIG